MYKLKAKEIKHGGLRSFHHSSIKSAPPAHTAPSHDAGPAPGDRDSTGAAQGVFVNYHSRNNSKAKEHKSKMHLVHPCTRPGRVRVRHQTPPEKHGVLGGREQRAEQTLQQDRNTTSNLPKAGKGLPQHQHQHQHLLKHQGQPQEAFPDQLPKFTVTPVPPNGPGKEFGWGRTWISPVPALPAQAAPEGSSEPSLVTNSIKTTQVKRAWLSLNQTPRENSFLCQPWLPTTRSLGYEHRQGNK